MSHWVVRFDRVADRAAVAPRQPRGQYFRLEAPDFAPVKRLAPDVVRLHTVQIDQEDPGLAPDQQPAERVGEETAGAAAAD